MQINTAKPTIYNSLLADLDRVLDMPKVAAAEKAKATGWIPPTTTRVVSALEWMEIAGVNVEALFVHTDTFDQLIDEFIFTHPTIRQPDDGCNCIVLPRKDGKGAYNIFRTTKPAEDYVDPSLLAVPKRGGLIV